MIDTSEIIVSKTHIEPLRDDGYVIYKLGYITPVVNGRREAQMIMGNRKYPSISLPLEITGITLLSASWTLVSGLYEYDLANANIIANHVVDVIPENADIAIVKAAEILPKTVSSAGSVKLYSANAPTGNIGVTIILTTATT